jgi:AraC-like DNA-binding protein
MTNIVPLLESKGLDPAAVLKPVKLHPKKLSDPNNRLDYHQADEMLLTCAQQTGYEHFGLLLGRMAEPWHLGLAGLVVYYAPSVKRALQDFSGMLDLHDEAGDALLDIGPEYTRMSFVVSEPGVLSIEIVNDLAIAVLCKIMRVLCGPRWVPTAVSIPRHKPKNLSHHNRYFRAPLYFDTPELALTFENRWLMHSPTTSDPSRYRQIKVRAAELHDQTHQELIDKLPVAIRRGLLLGQFSAHEVAENIGMHERTLHRRLKTAGTSFRNELDRARQSFAAQLLEGTSMPIRDIASALGYTHTSSFIRAFERWCETSPALWRAERSDPAGNAANPAS